MAGSPQLHPNSLRYRLRRIAELTGLDPTRMNDLLELLAASRLMHDVETRNLRAVSITASEPALKLARAYLAAPAGTVQVAGT